MAHTARTSQDIAPYLQTSYEALHPSILTLSRHLDHVYARKRELYNRNLPIASLPIEILHIIFHYHALENPIERSFREPRRSPFAAQTTRVGRSWFILGQVCRLWRRVLFSMSDIWADRLFDLGGRKAHTLIPFAKDAMMNIDLHQKTIRDAQKWEDWEPRMRSAWRITNNRRQFTSFAKLLSSDPLPHLRAIELTGFPFDRHPFTVMSDHTSLRSVTMLEAYMRPPLRQALVPKDRPIAL